MGYVKPFDIRQEELNYKNLVLSHVAGLGTRLLAEPVMNPNGTITDFSPRGLYMGVRFLDSLLKFYDADYNGLVERKGWRTNILIPHPHDQFTAGVVAKLFEWFDEQTKVFPKLGVSPVVEDLEPEEMSIFDDTDFISEIVGELATEKIEESEVKKDGFISSDNKQAKNTNPDENQP